MITAVDTNVLSRLLFVKGDEKALAISATLQAQKAKGGLVVCALVYSELLAIGGAEGVRGKLREMRIDVDPVFDEDVCQAAAAAWRRYLRNRKKTGGQGRYLCECGRENAFFCQGCGRPLGGPRRVLADFLIGAHAAKRAQVLLSYDRGVYRTYFPQLPLIEP